MMWNLLSCATFGTFCVFCFLKELQFPHSYLVPPPQLWSERCSRLTSRTVESLNPEKEWGSKARLAVPRDHHRKRINSFLGPKLSLKDLCFEAGRDLKVLS